MLNLSCEQIVCIRYLRHPSSATFLLTYSIEVQLEARFSVFRQLVRTVYTSLCNLMENAGMLVKWDKYLVYSLALNRQSIHN